MVDGSGQVPDDRERRCPQGRTGLMPLGRRGLLMTWTSSDAFPSNARVEHRALPSPARRRRPDSHAMQHGADRLGSRARVFGVTCMIGMHSPVTPDTPPRSITSMQGKVVPVPDAGPTPFKMAGKAFPHVCGELEARFRFRKGARSRERGLSERRGHILPLGSHVTSVNQGGAGAVADGRSFDRRPSESSRSVPVRRPRPSEQCRTASSGRATVRAVWRERPDPRGRKGVKTLLF